MNTDTMLDKIAAYGYGVYSAAGKIIIADPLDGVDGFYLEVDSLEEACREFDTGVLAHIEAGAEYETCFHCGGSGNVPAHTDDNQVGYTSCDVCCGTGGRHRRQPVEVPGI